MPKQLRLLPAPQPLVELLGTDFFREIPKAPGIYRMYDPADRLIYVGKARDLRARLATYRRTHGQSRKTRRLIHAVQRIDWEVCIDETTARLRENHLIRTLRPFFNRAGAWPASARFIRLREADGGFELDVTGDPTGESYGAFRGGTQIGLAALARLLWFAWHAHADPRDLPHSLLAADRLERFRARHADATSWLPALRSFLDGATDDFVVRLIAEIPEPDIPFDAIFLANQFECLLDFFRRGPVRNSRLRALLPGPRRTLTPEEHDDLSVQASRTPGL